MAEVTVDYLLSNIGRLFSLIGDEGECRGCRRTVWWVRHKNGKGVPYDPDGLNHFASCPQANQFKEASVPRGTGRNAEGGK